MATAPRLKLDLVWAIAASTIPIGCRQVADLNRLQLCGTHSGRPARSAHVLGADEWQQPPAIAFAKGDYVVVIWERESKDPADPTKTYKFNTYDLLRLQNGKVQEHWDWAQEKKNLEIAKSPQVVRRSWSSSAASASPSRSKPSGRTSRR